MPRFFRSGRRVTVRARAVALVLHLAVFPFVAPMLVLCEDGDRHAAVESALSRCCPPGADAPSAGSRAPELQGSAGNGCAGSCTDTPFPTHIDLISPRNIAQGFEAPDALPLVVSAPSPAFAVARGHVGCWPVLPPLAFGRSSVLLL